MELLDTQVFGLLADSMHRGRVRGDRAQTARASRTAHLVRDPDIWPDAPAERSLQDQVQPVTCTEAHSESFVLDVPPPSTPIQQAPRGRTCQPSGSSSLSFGSTELLGKTYLTCGPMCLVLKSDCPGQANRT